jgi:hypothetical protein
MYVKNMLNRLFLWWILMLICQAGINAQQADTLKGRNIYNPVRLGSRDTIPAQTPEEIKRIRDSIDMRMQLVQDSLVAREQYVRDSIQHRQRMLDSLTFLQQELQSLLDAYFRTVKEDIIFRSQKIPIVGDSILGDFIYLTMPFGVSEPYTPWKARIGLTGKYIRIGVDKKIQKIVSVQTPQMKAAFIPTNVGNLLIIQEPPVVQNNYNGNFYKTPVDSVFFDRYKRVVKIKRYVQFYSVVNNNQRGTPLFINRMLVKQYEYGPDNEITQYQVVKFCDRWKVYEANKVCSILTFTFAKLGNTYLLTRRNNPANSYSDGTYSFAFDNRENLTGISFKNTANTENWQRLIELNKDGNVNCYIDKTNDIIIQSNCMIYHDKDPKAKYPVEIINTTFEKDGISYHQKNNTTGLSRTRDRMTLEWSPWR